MNDMERLIEALALIDKLNNKYISPRDYEVRYHTACIKAKFSNHRAAMEASHANS